MTNDSKVFGYSIVATGVILALLSAIVPFYDAAYRLYFGVFFAGISPYLLFAVLVTNDNSRLTDAVGVVLVTAHFGLVINQRYVDGADYSDGAIYYLPLGFAALLIPLVINASRYPWHE